MDVSITNGSCGTVRPTSRAGIPIVTAGLTEEKAEAGAGPGVGIGL